MLNKKIASIFVVCFAMFVFVYDIASANTKEVDEARCKASGGSGLDMVGNCNNCPTSPVKTHSNNGVCTDPNDEIYVPGAGTGSIYRDDTSPNTNTNLPVGSNGQITNYTIPGQSVSSSGIVKCGRPGQKMCTLCDLIAGLNVVIQYIMKLAIGIGLAAFTLGGLMYIISAGDTGMTGKAKTTMKNAAIGFVIIFGGWVIINSTMMVVGAKQNLGIRVTSWGNFSCQGVASQR